MTHTPGPWKTRSHRSNSYVSGGVDDSKEELWITVQTPGDDVRAANARLIAAAPDLLAALREMLCQFADHEQYDEDGYDTAAINNARAAIAKATGGDACA